MASTLQLYGAPISEGTLQFAPNESKGDIVVQEPEFFVAITHRQLEDAGIDLPLAVARINRSDWRVVQN